MAFNFDFGANNIPFDIPMPTSTTKTNLSVDSELFSFGISQQKSEPKGMMSAASQNTYLQATLRITDLSILCSTALKKINETMEQVATLMGHPPKYDQTDFEAFEVVKQKFDGLKTQSSELSAFWKTAEDDLKKIRQTLDSAQAFHETFDTTVTEIQSGAQQSMNSVRFSSTEGLQISPMTTYQVSLFPMICFF